jgi:hypothetical protein
VIFFFRFLFHLGTRSQRTLPGMGGWGEEGGISENGPGIKSVAQH